MSPRTRTTHGRKTRAAHDENRTFKVAALPPTAKGTYGLRIYETYGPDAQLSHLVVGSSPAQTARVIDVLLTATRRAGNTPSDLAGKDGGTVTLDEATGVRLSLTLLATQPIIRSERIRSLVAGIEAMSVEETYYWYAKCVGPNAAAARKAIRILLADDETGAQQ